MGRLVVIFLLTSNLLKKNPNPLYDAMLLLKEEIGNQCNSKIDLSHLRGTGTRRDIPSSTSFFYGCTDIESFPTVLYNKWKIACRGEKMSKFTQSTRLQDSSIWWTLYSPMKPQDWSCKWQRNKPGRLWHRFRMYCIQIPFILHIILHIILFNILGLQVTTLSKYICSLCTVVAKSLKLHIYWKLEKF